MNQKVIIAADHGGVALKDAVVAHLKSKSFEVVDLGTHGTESVDYPDYSKTLCRALQSGEFELGILVCTTGIGMSMSANRFEGIRAALVNNVELASKVREHNDANVLCLGQTQVALDDAPAIVDAFLAGAFEGGRHQRRISKMDGELAYQDPDLYEPMLKERQRQQNNIELIASENFASSAVREAQGSHLTNKYAEGYPGRRWYGGCEFVDEVETIAIERAKALFGADHANVQPHSGSQANTAVYFSVLKPGDTILTMDLAHGGHLTHGHKANFSGKLYSVVHYGVSETDERIDYDHLQKLAEESKPRMITAGASAYPRTIDFERMAEIAKSVEAYLFVDMAHISGLVAGGVHPSPVPFADFVTSTTHKSLRGPRGGIILCKEEYAKKIDSNIFPGVQGGPLMHVIAAKAACFGEALKDDFKVYQAQIVKNAQALAQRLVDNGIRVVSGGTENHLMLADLRPLGVNGAEAESALDEAGITVNKNAIPFDTGSPMKPSGIRIGTPAVTTRGMKEDEMRQIADWITEGIHSREDKRKLDLIRNQVKALNLRFPLP